MAQQAGQGVILGAQGLVPDLREAEVSAGEKLKRKKATVELEHNKIRKSEGTGRTRCSFILQVQVKSHL